MLKKTAKTEQLPTTLHDTKVCNLEKRNYHQLSLLWLLTCACVRAFFSRIFFPRVIVLAMEEVKTWKVLDLQKSAGFIQLNRSCIIGNHLGAVEAMTCGYVPQPRNTKKSLGRVSPSSWKTRPWVLIRQTFWLDKIKLYIKLLNQAVFFLQNDVQSHVSSRCRVKKMDFPSTQTSLHLPISYLWSTYRSRIGEIHLFSPFYLTNRPALWLLFMLRSQNFPLLKVSSPVCCRATWRNTACTSGRSLSTCSTERRISSRAKPRRRKPSAMPAGRWHGVTDQWSLQSKKRHLIKSI